MMYLTEEQAKKILDNGFIDLALLYNENPNLPACRAMKDVIVKGNGDYYSAAIGFILGLAAGKHMERERRKAHNLKVC